MTREASGSAGVRTLEVAIQRLPAALANGTALGVWADLIPDALAVAAPSGNRTFAELEARCNQLARALRRHGLAAGDSVALLCGNRAEFAEVMWATRRTGLRVTTLNWHLTAGEASYIVDDCDAKVLFVDAQFAALGVELAGADANANVGKLQHRLAIGGPIEGYDDYEAWIASESSAEIENPTLGTQMLYTSGTTGRPKGVYKPPAAAPLSTTTIAANYLPGASLHLLTGPLYHAAPLAFSLMLPHAFGCGVVMMERWDAEQALALIERHRITHTHMVPTMFHRLLTLPESARRRHDLSSLGFILHGAAPCPVPLKQALMDWLGPIVHEYYAATEGTGTAVDPETWLRKPGTVGLPSPADHVRILDERGQLLAAGQVGLVYLKGPDQGRFQYHNDPEKTEKAYRNDYFTLGDLGYLDEEGYLFLTDRSAHLIISGGVNIYPAEIEAVLMTHPAIEDVGVIGVPNTEWGEEVKAVATLQRGWVRSTELTAELIAYCRNRLAHYKCPKSVDFVDELPRHDNGKLYKQKLRESYRPRSS